MVKRDLLRLLLFVALAVSASFGKTFPNCWFTTSSNTLGPAYVGNARVDEGGFIVIGTVSVPSPCYTTNAAFVPWQPDFTSNTYDVALYCIRGNITDNTGCVANQGYVHLGPTPGYIFYSICATNQCYGTLPNFVQVESWEEGRTLLPAGDYALGMGTTCNDGGGGGGTCGMGLGEYRTQSQLFQFKWFTSQWNGRTGCMVWANGLPANLCTVPTFTAYWNSPHMINFAIFGVDQ